MRSMSADMLPIASRCYWKTNFEGMEMMSLSVGRARRHRYRLHLLQMCNKKF